MHTLTVDPQSGFLQDSNYIHAFTAEKKELLVQYLETRPFQIREACKTVGIDPATFYRHVKDDPLLAQRVQAVKERRVEEIEQKLSDMALVDDSPADRIFFLKCWKPDRYNPTSKSEQKISVTVDTIAIQHAIERQQIIEAQFISDGKESASITQSTVTPDHAPTEHLDTQALDRR